MKRIYLDYNATSPLRPEAREAMRSVLDDHFGNPSSVHWAGAEARARVECARAELAAVLGVAPETLVFTSSATESNNTILRSAALRAPQHGDELVTCATEHPSVLETCQELRERGLRVRVLPVEADGRLDPERFAESLCERTLLASIMWANNETGVIQPIPELSRIAQQHDVAFHTDAVQALGKLPVPLGKLPIAYASFSAHKLGGPKGVGALYARAGTRFSSMLRGGSQERRRRAGTENVPGIIGFGAACTTAQRDLDANSRRLRELRDRLWQGAVSKVPEVSLNGSLESMLPHTLNVSFAGVEGEVLLAALDLEGVAVASGAACMSGSAEPSHVLLAMGLSPQQSLASLRFSLGFDTTAAEIECVLEMLPDVVARVRAAAAQANTRTAPA